jgi:hypothetical protein
MNDQPNSNSFKNKALSHIPPDLVQSMLKSTKVETEGLGSILEAIAKNVPSASPLPQKPEAPTQSQFVTIAIDNVAIKVPVDPFQGAMTLFTYLLATVWSKDKRIAKVLKSFNFSFSDCNGTIIYPLSAKQKRGKKK